MAYELIPEVRAWELLHDPEYCSALSSDDYLELCKAAGFSEEQAQKVASERAWQRMRRDLPP